ncbi:MAG TPA: NADPH-dependent FMN reductase [Candidatus Binatia bacterium]|jgi:NAD(P)H-dependent FMN reductase|nr:NADPH-dependent FMN reductase [Candidatus Binatia bacterium]
MRFVVIYGSVRTTRQGIKAARFVVRALETRGHTVTLLDAQPLALPLLDRMYKEYAPGTAPATLETIAGHLRTADGFVIVTGEYNHGLPPGLTNLLDHFLEEWFWRPSAIVSYSGGSFGGVRAAIHLRAMLGELGMSSIPSIFPVPKVQDAFDDDGTPRDPATSGRFERFASELEWYAGALTAARAHGTPY